MLKVTDLFFFLNRVFKKTKEHVVQFNKTSVEDECQSQ